MGADVDNMPDEKMRQYSTGWSDEQVIEWDGNFRDDGALFLICSERDTEIAEYQRCWRSACGIGTGLGCSGGDLSWELGSRGFLKKMIAVQRFKSSLAIHVS
jgi:hypothetical protein